jgi:transposase InsO family protein
VSKARLVITAVVVEGRKPGEVAEAYGVSRSWVYELLARYRAEGEAAFEPRSRRPKRSPRALPDTTVEMIVRLREQLTDEGLDAGPDTIRWHLQHHHGVVVSRATVARYLTKRGFVAPQPRKRPKTSYIRFQAEQPNECWQADFTHYPLVNGGDVEILTFLDDHSRYALTVTAHQPVTGPAVVEAFGQAVDRHGPPASTLTDNGMVFTTRFAGGRGGRNGFESELRRLGIVQKNSRPNHPTTCGKVERFQQTLKNWLTAQPHQPATVTELQALLDAFVDGYNHHRPHRSLAGRATPAAAYQSRPKATPTSDRRDGTHWRIRHDTVDNWGKVTLRHNGRLHHIGIGATHARTPITLLVADLDIRVIHTLTGELLRHLTLDPTRDYQPTGRPPGPPPQKPQQTEPQQGFGLSGMS